eukprot:1875482-Amphidinium_carterae.2
MRNHFDSTKFSTVAEQHYNKLHRKENVAEQRKTTTSSATGLHIIEWVCSTCTPPSLQVNDSILVVGTPRLASTSMSTLTTTSTVSDGIYMLSAKQQTHRSFTLRAFGVSRLCKRGLRPHSQLSIDPGSSSSETKGSDTLGLSSRTQRSSNYLRGQQQVRYDIRFDCYIQELASESHGCSTDTYDTVTAKRHKKETGNNHTTVYTTLKNGHEITQRTTTNRQRPTAPSHGATKRTDIIKTSSLSLNHCSNCHHRCNQHSDKDQEQSYETGTTNLLTSVQSISLRNNQNSQSGHDNKKRKEPETTIQKPETIIAQQEPDQPEKQQEQPRRLTTKTTPPKSGLQATIDTSILHLTTNEDEEEKTLTAADY